MEKLRKSVLAAERRNRNFRGHYFSSEQDIREILTEDAVRNALCDKTAGDNCNIAAEHIEHAVRFVADGAYRIFAILVHIRHTKSLLRFIEGDNYQKGLDSRLPFEKEMLKAIFGCEEAAHEFYERQWHFIAPVFCDSVLKRILPIETILPITKEEFLGKGSFGDVYRIDIAPSHQHFKSDKLNSQQVCQCLPV